MLGEKNFPLIEKISIFAPNYTYLVNYSYSRLLLKTFFEFKGCSYDFTADDRGHILPLKRTVARSRRASRVRQTRQVNTPRAQDNLSKLLAALSAITAPSAGTHQNLCTFLVRVPALGAAMVESAVSRLTRARRTR